MAAGDTSVNTVACLPLRRSQPARKESTHSNSIFTCSRPHRRYVWRDLGAPRGNNSLCQARVLGRVHMAGGSAVGWGLQHSPDREDEGQGGPGKPPKMSVELPSAQHTGAMTDASLWLQGNFHRQRTSLSYVAHFPKSTWGGHVDLKNLPRGFWSEPLAERQGMGLRIEGGQTQGMEIKPGSACEVVFTYAHNSLLLLPSRRGA